MTGAPRKTKRKVPVRGYRKNRHVLARILAAVSWFAVILCAVLWRLDSSLPGFVRRQIERKLSSGPVACSIGGASFNIFHGLEIRQVRVHRKRSLRPPVGSAELVRVMLDPGIGRSPWTWPSSIYVSGLKLAPYGEWEDMAEEFSGDGGQSGLEGLLASLAPKDGEPPAKVRIVAENADVLEVRCRFVEFDVSFPHGALMLDDVSIVPDAVGYLEMLKGKLAIKPSEGTLEATLAGTLTPDAVRDLTLALGGDVAVEYYDAVSGIQTPLSAFGEVKCGIGGAGDDFTDIRLTLGGADFMYRGQPVKNFKMGLQWLSDARKGGRDARRLVISPLTAEFAEGGFSGKLAWYPVSHATDIRAKSSVPANQFFTIVDLQAPSFMTNVVFSIPPRIELSGRVFPRGFGNDFFTGTVAAAKAVAMRVPLDDISAKWTYEEEKAGASIHDFRATCCDGGVEASLEFSTSGERAFSLDFNASDIRTDPLRRIFDQGAPVSDGRLAVAASLSGSMASNILSSISGKASFSIRKAAITRIPLFAGLTEFMSRNVIGVDLLVMQSDSDADITLRDGILSVERLSVDGNMLSIIGKGKTRIDKPGMPTEGVAQVRFFHSRSLMGMLARVVTLPVSKLMEFRVYGPILKPRWDYIGLIDRIAEATFWPRKDATEE